MPSVSVLAAQVRGPTAQRARARTAVVERLRKRAAGLAGAVTGRSARRSVRRHRQGPRATTAGGAAMPGAQAAGAASSPVAAHTAQSASLASGDGTPRGSAARSPAGAGRAMPATVQISPSAAPPCASRRAWCVLPASARPNCATVASRARVNAMRERRSSAKVEVMAGARLAHRPWRRFAVEREGTYRARVAMTHQVLARVKIDALRAAQG